MIISKKVIVISLLSSYILASATAQKDIFYPKLKTKGNIKILKTKNIEIKTNNIKLELVWNFLRSFSRREVNYIEKSRSKLKSKYLGPYRYSLLLITKNGKDKSDTGKILWIKYFLTKLNFTKGEDIYCDFMYDEDNNIIYTVIVESSMGIPQIVRLYKVDPSKQVCEYPITFTKKSVKDWPKPNGLLSQYKPVFPKFDFTIHGLRLVKKNNFDKIEIIIKGSWRKPECKLVYDLINNTWQFTIKSRKVKDITAGAFNSRVKP
jgi:hypothetical protein